MSSKVKSAIVLASAAAALFSTGAAFTTTAHAEDMTVKCAGLHSCKGHSDCQTAKNECKGLNSCKGMSWNTKASAKECTTAGGTVLK